MIRRLPVLLMSAAVVATLAAGAPVARGQDLPRVRVITTGGTIGTIGTAELTAAGLIAAIPPLAENARIELEEFVRTGSSGMTPDHWLRLSARVNEVLDADPDLAGVVVTHGTDTMEETAYVLHLTVDDERPVVVTGSMRSSDAISADGPANVLSAVRVAADPAARGRGVLVVLNDEIHSARDVRKTDSNRVETFISAEWGALGVADSDRIVFRRAILTRHTNGSEMVGALRGVAELPLVPIVADFAGNDGSEVRAWADRGARGIVVQAFGGGRSSPKMTEAMRDVASRGIPVVRASRVPEGRVLRSDAQTEAGIVTSEDLPPHKARVLLMLALLETRSTADIQRIFDTH